MAKPIIPSYFRVSEHVFVDRDGNVVMTAGSREANVPGADGAVQQTNSYMSFETVDGRMVGPGDKFPLFVCQACRRGQKRWMGPDEPPTHGLVTEDNSFLCCCGLRCCRRHGQRVDGEWRCRDCALGWSLKALFHRVFFVRVEDSE